MPTIPLFSAQTANAGLDFLTPITRVLDSHWYILGAELAAFEREFAEYCGVGHCVGLANGTDALELGLRAVGVKAGDEVLLAANAGFYGSTAVRQIGALPLYVDVDANTLTMAVEQLERSLSSSTKAIIITHLYGQLAPDLDSIVAVAGKAGLPVVEDCAQAHGAKRNGKRAGSFGTIGCFSFYPTKNLGALGDGGAVVTNEPSLAARMQGLRQYGWSSKYHVALEGGRNSRLDELQAAILRAKLPRLDAWNAERREIAHRYNAAFSNLPVLCPSSSGEDYVAHLYVLQIEARDAFREYLTSKGIATDIHYPIADHLQAAYQGGPRQGPLPVSEHACTRVVSLPCYPGLEPDKVERVIQAVQSYFTQAGG